MAWWHKFLWKLVGRFHILLFVIVCSSISFGFTVLSYCRTRSCQCQFWESPKLCARTNSPVATLRKTRWHTTSTWFNICTVQLWACGDFKSNFGGSSTCPSTHQTVLVHLVNMEKEEKEADRLLLDPYCTPQSKTGQVMRSQTMKLVNSKVTSSYFCCQVNAAVETDKQEKKKRREGGGGVFKQEPIMFSKYLSELIVY